MCSPLLNSTNLLLAALIASVLPGCGQDPRIEARQILNSELAARRTEESESVRLCRMAADAYDKGDLAAARQHATDAVSAYDRNAQAWMLMGLIEQKEDRVFDAAESFHKASMLAPNRYEPVYNIGVLLESFGRYRQAVEHYQAALKLSPNQVEVMENLARCYVRTNTSLDEAEDLIGRALVTEQRPEWRRWLSDQSGLLAKRRGSAQ